MSLPTIEEITNFYLYGTSTKPDDLESDEIIRIDAPIVIEVDIDEYMDYMQRYVSPANFAHVQAFLSNEPDIEIPVGQYVEDDIITYYEMDNGNKAYSIQQYNYDPNSPDYAERVYVWNSTGFEIDETTTRFVVHKDGSRSIENLSVVPLNSIVHSPGVYAENFDFETEGFLSNIGDEIILEDMIDPSRIGRTVNIDFTGPRDVIPSYTLADLERDTARIPEANGSLVSDALPMLHDVALNLFNEGAQVSRFVDAEGRAIIYGSNLNDTMDEYTTPVGDVNLRYNLLIPLHDYISEGIHYIAGGGLDNVHGTRGNDELHGGSVSDHVNYGGGLYGESGDDALYGEAGHDYLEGGDDRDLLVGGRGQDHLLGGDGFDNLYGGNRYLDRVTNQYVLEDDSVTDRLEGGDGDDLYFAGAGDVINDSDGQGTVCMNVTAANGQQVNVMLGLNPIRRIGSTNVYEETNPVYGATIRYTLNGNILTVSDTRNSNNSITIEHFSNFALGINLSAEYNSPLWRDPDPEHISYWFDWYWSMKYTESYNVSWPTGANLFEDAISIDIPRFIAISWETGVDGDANIIEGDDRDDVLTGSPEDDRMNGGRGDDILTGDWGDDWLFGFDDNDALQYHPLLRNSITFQRAIWL